MGTNPGTREPIEFGTDGWRAQLSEFTTDRVEMVAQAVATYLDDQNDTGAVAIGYDAREHSSGFANAIAEVLTGNGRTVVVSSRDCPTPALAWTVADGDFAGGLVITASHNPPDYNGIKFITADGSPALPAVTDELEHRLSPPQASDGQAERRDRDLLSPFVDHVSGFLSEQFDVSTTLDGVTVAYDAMHGSGRGVTDEVLSRAGATVTRRRCERKTDFGGTAPEPTPENASALVEKVRDGDADIGFVNDGDADRVGIVTPERGFVDPNVVLALIYDFLLEHAHGDVVRTVPTSSLVDRIASAHGEAVRETAVGFKWVAEAMGEYDALAGGEESGGYGVAAHLRNKDGVLLTLLAGTAHARRPLDERIDDLFDTYGQIHQRRRSLDCPHDQKTNALTTLKANLPDRIGGVAVDSVSSVDGIKLVLDDGTWLLVRPSGTEPKMRIYAEARSENRVDELLAAGQEVVRPMIEE
jgi:phosphomannomutase